MVETVSYDLADMSLHCQLRVQQDTQVMNYWLVTDNNVIIDLQQAIRGGCLLKAAAGIPNQISFRRVQL